MQIIENLPSKANPMQCPKLHVYEICNNFETDYNILYVVINHFVYRLSYFTQSD